jgi:hypothetical protein
VNNLSVGPVVSSTFRERALLLVARGIAAIPLRPKTKIAILPGWEKSATADLEQIEAWSREYPDANCGAVAQAKLDGFWFLEVDSIDVLQRIKTETGKILPVTMTVQSSPERVHFYFRQSEASLRMGNIAQGFVKNNDWSARVDRMYVVGPQSIHVATGLPYEILSRAEIAEAPDWLVEWCIFQRVEKKSTGEIDDGEPILESGRNTRLTSIAGKLRHAGSSHDEIETILLRINSERCRPPLDEMEVKTIAGSVSRYSVGKDESVLISGIPVGSGPQSTQPAQLIAAPEIPVVPYPEFPEWVMLGTSIYEGLVKPVCDVNSRCPEFMFMPAMALLLNYLGTRVRIKFKDIMPSVFLILIGEKGRTMKSSSMNDAAKYLGYAGIIDHAGGATKNAEGRSLIWTVGSPEGLGIEMARTNCKNAVLLYDELSTLTSKAGIDSSTLGQALLTLYESGKFQNIIKSKKDSFSIDPGTYCASLIACNTAKNFQENWSRLALGKEGMDDRFFFLLQPETLKPLELYTHVSTQQGAMQTRELIDKAISQGVYRISNQMPLQAIAKEIGNRSEIRAEKFALAFAVDLGLDEIDDDCVERAVALARYERAVKKYLGTGEADNKMAAIQLKLRRILERAPGGRLPIRDLLRKMNYNRYDTDTWGRIYTGLSKAGIIREEGAGTKESPKFVQLMVVIEEDD